MLECWGRPRRGGCPVHDSTTPLLHHSNVNSTEAALRPLAQPPGQLRQLLVGGRLIEGELQFRACLGDQAVDALAGAVRSVGLVGPAAEVGEGSLADGETFDDGVSG